jgi:hypothetical protein
VFTVVRYEDLMIHPERELKRLCAFLGEDFEPSQIDGNANVGPVQECEAEWKAKARERPDPSRAEAWRRCGDQELIAKLNFYMGKTLRECGYPDTEVSGTSLFKRLIWRVQALPFVPGVFPVLLFVRRTVRRMLGLKRDSRSEGTGSNL